jgi:hypothetical protein
VLDHTALCHFQVQTPRTDNKGKISVHFHV